MLFNSYIFIFAFLPITWALYFIINRFGRYRLAEAVLVMCSLVFYGYKNWRFAFLLIGSILVNYAIYTLFNKVGEDKAKKGIRVLLLILGLLINFGILAYFKYVNFFLENLAVITGSDFVLRDIVLPLGISFYTFQQVSFVVDSYRGQVKGYGFWEYALFVSFFPQLIAGPIVLHSEMVPQFRDETRKRINSENVYDGLIYFITGLAKKVLIADMLGRGVDWGYDNILDLNSLSAVTLVVLYTLQIYFDFSGYCDMAMGIGRLFNLDIVKNFDSPYKSLSVTEFWKRWHITLTRFFTTYLYIPLGGNRKGKWRTYLNVFIVFAVSGLWHGADWTFVLWGVLHGLMMIFERLIGVGRNESKKEVETSKDPTTIRPVRDLWKWLYTFTFVSLAWVLFRADSFEDAMNVYKRIIHGGPGFVLSDMRDAILMDKSSLIFDQLDKMPFAADGIRNVIFAVVILAIMFITVFWRNSHEIVQGITYKEHTSLSLKLGECFRAVLLGLLFVLCVISLTGISKFLYFNF